MGQPDLAQKSLESYPDVFADIVNALMYEGREVLRADTLMPAPTESIYLREGKLKNQFQDVGMYVVKYGKKTARYMLENQMKKDRLMPLRKAGYQGVLYKRQYDTREVYPIVGAVLYWGKPRWKHMLRIKDLLRECESYEETSEFTDDIKLHVYEMRYLSNQIRKRFKSDMRIVLDYLAEGKDFNPSGYRIRHVAEFLKFMSALTKDKRYEELIPEVGEEEVEMCELIDRYENKGRREGKREGTLNSLKALMQTMDMTLDKAMDALLIPENSREYYRKALQ